MANLDELERLAQLKEKGFLSSEEFEKQKADLLAGIGPRISKSPRRKRSYKIPLILTGIAIFGFPFFLETGPGGVPACDSSDTRTALKGAIEDSPTSNLVNIKFLDLREVTELSYHPDKNERNCKGRFVLNSGDELLSYRVHMNEPNASQFFVEIR